MPLPVTDSPHPQCPLWSFFFCGTRASPVAEHRLRRAGSAAGAHGPSRSAARGILPDRGTNPCPLHRQADSQPLRHQGSPRGAFDMCMSQLVPPVSDLQIRSSQLMFACKYIPLTCLLPHSYSSLYGWKCTPSKPFWIHSYCMCPGTMLDTQVKEHSCCPGGILGVCMPGHKEMTLLRV